MSKYNKKPKKDYTYEVERPRFEGNPKRLFLRPVRRPDELLLELLARYRGTGDHSKLGRPRPRPPLRPAPARPPLKRLPKSLFSNTGLTVTSTPPSSQDSYQRFLKKLHSPLSSSSPSQEPVLERPS
jgi:hypothetical protein